MNCEEVVSELNQEIFDKLPDSEFNFYYETNGYIDAILFNRELIWHSEDESREWIEEANDYEPMLPFIKKAFNKYVDRLTSLKFELWKEIRSYSYLKTLQGVKACMADY